MAKKELISKSRFIEGNQDDPHTGNQRRIRLTAITIPQENILPERLQLFYKEQGLSYLDYDLSGAVGPIVIPDDQIDSAKRLRAERDRYYNDRNRYNTPHRWIGVLGEDELRNWIPTQTSELFTWNRLQNAGDPDFIFGRQDYTLDSKAKNGKMLPKQNFLVDIPTDQFRDYPKHYYFFSYYYSLKSHLYLLGGTDYETFKTNSIRIQANDLLLNGFKAKADGLHFPFIKITPAIEWIRSFNLQPVQVAGQQIPIKFE